jgi:hypothetical protein
LIEVPQRFIISGYNIPESIRHHRPQQSDLKWSFYGQNLEMGLAQHGTNQPQADPGNPRCPRS